MFFLQIVILLCLAFIFYQDLSFRAVYWFCFPVLAILLSVLKYRLTDFNDMIVDAGYAMGFLLVQLLFLWIYFSVKHKSMVNITNNYLGWGDILFLIAITCYLSPGNYVLFYIASLILVLLYAVFSKYVIRGTNHEHIPLAGLQALLLGMIMIAGFLWPVVRLYDDNWIYLLMIKA